MNLTKEQIEAADHGETVEIRVNESQFVLLRKDVFERLKSLYDDSEWTESEMQAMASHAFDEADSAGPIE